MECMHGFITLIFEKWQAGKEAGDKSQDLAVDAISVTFWKQYDGGEIREGG